MPNIDETWVRERAHQIWIAEGKPDGKDFDHWYAAADEFRAQAVKAPVKAPAAKKTPAKAAADKTTAKPVKTVEAKVEAVAVTEPAPTPAEAPAKKKAAANKPVA